MRAADSARYVLRSVSSHRLRSSLTALGIAVGIMAVSLLMSIGEGARAYVIDNFSQFGTRIIAIHPGKALTQGMGGLISTNRPLTLEDTDALRQLTHVTEVVPVVQGAGAVEFDRRKRNGDIIGVNHDMPAAWRFEVAQGRFLPRDPSGHSRPFAVLGHKMKKELFGTRSALGSFVRIGNQRFRVIGVMQEKGQLLGFDLDDIVYIPADKAQTLFNREGLMEINVVYGPGITSTEMANNVRQRLIQRHGQEDFSVTTQDEMLTSLDSILAVLSMAVSALGLISLFVGGVGILTIMTTSVRERFFEIGLLRALGASNRQIITLFVGEAVVFALLGGAAGVGMALLIQLLLTISFPALPLSFQPFYLLLAWLLAGLIGLLAGMLPAMRAARLNPVVALHDE